MLCCLRDGGAERGKSVPVAESRVQRDVREKPKLCSCVQERGLLWWQMQGPPPSLLLHQALLGFKPTRQSSHVFPLHNQ